MKKLLKSLDDFNILTLGELKRLETPEEFFKVLKDGFINSNEAYISTLYFGEDEQSNELIKLIEKRNKEGKRTIIICDKSRGMTEHIKKMIHKHRLYDNFYFKQLNYSFLPDKLSELLSVFHSKIILFDQKAILTGANINGSYFNDRLDRYFYTSSVELVNLIIGSLFIPVIQEDYNVGGFNIVRGKLGSLQSSVYVNKKGLKEKNVFGKAITALLEEQHNPMNVIDMLDDNNITTDPKILVYDEESEHSVLEALINRGFKTIYISTAYLNLPYKYIKLLRDTNVKLIVNDPDTNIFTEYGNFGSLVTDMYRYITFRTALNLPNAEIYEYRRDGYTMHMKGIWAFADTVAATMIGSSNLNRRSLERDNELNFLVVTTKPEHVKLLKEEVEDLISRSKIRSLEELKKRDYSLLIILIFIFFNRFF